MYDKIIELQKMLKVVIIIKKKILVHILKLQKNAEYFKTFKTN